MKCRWPRRSLLRLSNASLATNSACFTPSNSAPPSLSSSAVSQRAVLVTSSSPLPCQKCALEPTQPSAINLLPPNDSSFPRLFNTNQHLCGWPQCNGPLLSSEVAQLVHWQKTFSQVLLVYKETYTQRPDISPLCDSRHLKIHQRVVSDPCALVKPHATIFPLRGHINGTLSLRSQLMK